MVDHELHGFFRNYSTQMAASYAAIRPRISEDPGTSGDQGELAWTRVLQDWLPEGYSVETKGRILGASGAASPQIDIVILKPSYPKFLKREKYFIMGGVAAAFECKTTLRPTHIDKIMATAKAIANLETKKGTSVKSEIFSPIIYGVLAHTHAWAAAEDRAIEQISQKILASAKATASEPRELPELFCIADLAGWRLAHMPITHAILDPYTTPDPVRRAKIFELVKEKYSDFPIHLEHVDENFSQVWFERPNSMYVTQDTKKIMPDGEPNPYAERYTPIGAFIAALYDKLAYRDTSLLDITQYFGEVHIPSSSGGLNSLNCDLVWKRDVISDRIWSQWHGKHDRGDWADIYF